MASRGLLRFIAVTFATQPVTWETAWEMWSRTDDDEKRRIYPYIHTHTEIFAQPLKKLVIIQFSEKRMANLTLYSALSKSACKGITLS